MVDNIVIITKIMSLTTEKYNITNAQPFDSLGLFTFLRTYARRHKDDDPNSSVETWEECITRVVNSCNTQLNCNFTDEERQEFFDLLYNLKCSVAGRFLWQLGTRTVDKLGLMSLQNCAFTVIDEPVKPFTWIMNFLMLGAGCGYRISKEDVDKLPMVHGVEIIRRDEKDADFIVPDTRQGWVKLLGKVLKAHFYSGKGFTYSCHLLRSKGAPIKGFGGIASGPDELCKGIEQISVILNKKAGQKVNTVDCLDIANIIGRIVVSGNVRRCLPIGTSVQTNKGLVNIENINVGDMVATMKGYRKVRNFFYQGVQDLLEIKLMSGKSFVCTPNHKIAVYENFNFNNYVWKMAKDINTNTDFMIKYREVPMDNKIKYIYYNNENAENYKFPYFVEIDKVKEINFNQGNNYTYDLEVEEEHEFFSQGYLCHNSAQIALGDASDSDFMKAKRWDLGNIPNWRCYSNNSVICNDINEILDNEDFWSGYQGNGEPYGLINLKLCRKTGRIGDLQYPDESVEGVNPCSEQTLSRYETCCLADIFLPRVESYEQLLKSMKYLYRACKHSLALPCADSSETENIVHNNFRMGIGVTGYLQATDEQRAWLKPAYEELRKFDEEYSKINNFPPSVKLCTTKPSGCSRGDSLILTDNGLVRLDEMGNVRGEEWQKVENLQAFTDTNKLENITKFYINGKVETRKILTSDGLELESSLNHRYRVLDSEENSLWKRVDELKVGDRLLVKLGGHPKNISTKLKSAHELGCRMSCCELCKCSMKWPEFLDKDIAYFIGIYYAIGCVNVVNDNIVKFITKCQTVKKWIIKFIQKYFNINVINDENELYLSIDNENLRKWICVNNCKDKNNITKIIRCSSYENVHSFMEGFWFANNEGIGKFGDCWSGVITSKSLLNQLLQICRSLSYIVFAGQMEDQKFVDHLEHNNMLFFMNRDLANPHRYWEDGHSNDYWLDPIKSITASECDTYDIEVENAHHYRLGGVISHNTLSLLGHCTPGVHPAFSQYMIRRIRVSSESKLVKLAEDHGYRTEYVKNFDGTLDYTTKVIEFPYSYPEGTILAENCTAIDQMEWVKKMQTDYSDNAVSVTVYYKKEELPEIKEWLKKNYNDNVKAISFLLHSEHGFIQAPLEKITKEQYYELIENTRPITDVSTICYNSKVDENFIGEGECAGGACPLK